MSPSTNRSAKTSKTTKATKTTASSTKAKTTKSKAKKKDEELALEQDLEILPEMAESVSPSDEISHVTESGQVAETTTDSVVESETKNVAETTAESTAENIEEAVENIANQVAETVDESATNSAEPAAIAEIVDEKLASVGGRPKTTPISPPGEDKQYRAIGLVSGRYIASEEQFTKGTLITSDGTEIDAVLLGRVMTLLKNHLDLSKEHLWVVYPRSRQLENDLHLQIMGVWEPETLRKSMAITEASPQVFTPFIDLNNNYFSVRGEVIFQSVEEEYVVVKIKQAPKKPTEQPKFFKLKISGNLGDRPVNHFWDLHILLQGKCLCIQQANDIGVLFVKPPSKSGFKGKGKGRGGSFKPRYDSDKSGDKYSDRPRKIIGENDQAEKTVKPVKEKPTKPTES